MTDYFEEIIRNYSGASDVTKPTLALGTEVLNGSRWREIDTGRTYFYNSVDDTWHEFGPAIDRSTHALETVGYEHHEIHGGSHYYVSGFEVEDTDGTVIFGVTTPDTAKWAHMTFDITGTSRTEMSIHEGATITGGAGATPINNNRNSANTSVLTLVKDPTINVAGTLIFTSSSGLEGTTPAKADGGGLVSREREIILKQDTTYTFTITSRDDGNHISYLGEWYEHTDKA